MFKVYNPDLTPFCVKLEISGKEVVIDIPGHGFIITPHGGLLNFQYAHLEVVEADPKEIKQINKVHQVYLDAKVARVKEKIREQALERANALKKEAQTKEKLAKEAEIKQKEAEQLAKSLAKKPSKKKGRKKSSKKKGKKK